MIPVTMDEIDLEREIANHLLEKARECADIHPEREQCVVRMDYDNQLARVGWLLEKYHSQTVVQSPKEPSDGSDVNPEE